MAFAAVKVSRIPLFKASSSFLSWGSNGCSLTPHRVDVSNSRLAIAIAIAKSSARKPIVCSAVQESSTPTVSSETKEAKPEVKSEEKPLAAKPKAAAKVALKALPEMMEEDVIPSLRSILESQQDITEIELVFKDNQLQGSFLQNGKPYTFWAFFPDGNLTGPKGFSLSSYGSEVSTVEPFLVDEKKPTAKYVVFWIEKRLAAQGIIPVWEQ